MSSLVSGNLGNGATLSFPQNGRLVANVYSYNSITSDSYADTISAGAIHLNKDGTVTVGGNDISNCEVILVLNASPYTYNVTIRK